MGPRNIKLLVEYDGTAYSGWQYQPRFKTIQGEIVKAVERLTGEKVTLYAAGRTDAGVHALGQTANFKTGHRLPAGRFPAALNFHLPHDIRIVSAEEVSLDFHARYDAVYRHYRYLVGRRRTVFDRDRCWEIETELNVEKMMLANGAITGRHDFSAFCTVASQKADNHCLVYRSGWTPQAKYWAYDITADRFLHTMVRSLVGLMVEVGRGGLSLEQFLKIFRDGDHRAVRTVAPARGLCLIAVGY